MYVFMDKHYFVRSTKPYENFNGIFEDENKIPASLADYYKIMDIDNSWDQDVLIKKLKIALAFRGMGGESHSKIYGDSIHFSTAEKESLGGEISPYEGGFIKSINRKIFVPVYDNVSLIDLLNNGDLTAVKYLQGTFDTEHDGEVLIKNLEKLTGVSRERMYLDTPSLEARKTNPDCRIFIVENGDKFFISQIMQDKFYPGSAFGVSFSYKNNKDNDKVLIRESDEIEFK